ncbi:MAG: flagellar motor switch phosphatase FliY [Spirochaetaceae bacterium]|nr:MAG: flagellar motor switch phosphatase FliY [Spirochaetaceae bacterium]
MSDGSLSQDEIDALLQETESLEIDTGFGGGSEPLSEEDKRRFLALLEGVIDSQASNLSILTRKNVNLERPTLELVMGEEILDQLPDEAVDVKIDFTDGLQGEHSYLVDSATAQAIAGLMMGQSGVELDDAALSAVAEALSQISGPVATEIGNQSAKTVQNAPPDFQSVTKDKVRLPQGEVVVKLEYPLMIEGENPAKLVELFSLSLTKEIINATGAGAPDSGAAPAAAMGGAFAAAAGGQAAPQRAQAGIAQTFGQAFGGPQGLGMGTSQSPPNVQPVQFANLQGAGAQGEQGNIGLLMDVYMELTVELGRTRKLIREILGIGEGTIIELDKLAGEPVDILVNHKLIAKGEVVVIDENFGVRVTEIVSPMQRMSDLT